MRSLLSDHGLGTEGGGWMTLITAVISTDTVISELKCTCQEGEHLDSVDSAGNTLTIPAY